MDPPAQASHIEVVNGKTQNGLDQNEDKDGQANFVMEIAVGTREGGTLTLGGYRTHAEAKDEDDEECGDAGEEHVNTEPHRSSVAEVAPCQDGDGKGEENCYAGKSSWFGVIIGLVTC